MREPPKFHVDIPSPWQLVIAGFWLAIGFMLAPLVIGLLVLVVLGILTGEIRPVA